MRIDAGKCAELLATLQSYLNRTVATKSELQSILGKLMWVSKAVKYSRCFVSRIISETKSLSSQKQKTTLSHELRKDLLWWYHYMCVFNGVELLVTELVSIEAAGDACPAGMGAWNKSNHEYYSCRFPFYLMDPAIPIHIKEFICIIISVKIWGSKWAGKRCLIYCDNDAVCDVVSYQKPRDKEMQKYLREFLFFVCRYNFQPVVFKIGTKENNIADFISRNYCKDDAQNFFSNENLPPMKCIEIAESEFDLVADW